MTLHQTFTKSKNVHIIIAICKLAWTRQIIRHDSLLGKVIEKIMAGKRGRPRTMLLDHLMTSNGNRRFGQLKRWHNAETNGFVGVLNLPKCRAPEEEEASKRNVSRTNDSDSAPQFIRAPVTGSGHGQFVCRLPVGTNNDCDPPVALQFLAISAI